MMMMIIVVDKIVRCLLMNDLHLATHYWAFTLVYTYNDIS
mgnify:CR=1 FL=1